MIPTHSVIGTFVYICGMMETRVEGMHARLCAGNTYVSDLLTLRFANKTKQITPHTHPHPIPGPAQESFDYTFFFNFWDSFAVWKIYKQLLKRFL